MKASGKFIIQNRLSNYPGDHQFIIGTPLLDNGRNWKTFQKLFFDILSASPDSNVSPENLVSSAFEQATKKGWWAKRSFEKIQNGFLYGVPHYGLERLNAENVRKVLKDANVSGALVSIGYFSMKPSASGEPTIPVKREYMGTVHSLSNDGLLVTLRFGDEFKRFQTSKLLWLVCPDARKGKVRHMRLNLHGNPAGAGASVLWEILEGENHELLTQPIENFDETQVILEMPREDDEETSVESLLTDDLLPLSLEELKTLYGKVVFLVDVSDESSAMMKVSGFSFSGDELEIFGKQGIRFCGELSDIRFTWLN